MQPTTTYRYKTLFRSHASAGWICATNQLIARMEQSPSESNISSAGQEIPQIL